MRHDENRKNFKARIRNLAVLLLVAAASSAGAGARLGTDAVDAPNGTDDLRAIIHAGAEAIGGAAWDAGGTVVLNGTIEVGGATGSFRQSIDISTGRSRSDVAMGPLGDVSGFDGMPWTSQNGIVTEIDLPSLVSDARSAAFVDAAMWRSAKSAAGGSRAGPENAIDPSADAVRFAPSGGSPVTIWFDRSSHLPVRAVAEADGGLQTTDFADFRRVGGLLMPFKRTTTDPTGAITKVTLTEAHLAARDVGALARPLVERHGELRGGRPASVPFQFTGFDRGHVVVPASVDGHEVNLIFDSGGANYFAPESARALGLTTSGGVNILGVGEGSETGGFARVGTIEIGAALLRNESAVVAPLPLPAVRPRKGLETAGLTGYELLSEFQTTIDYEGRTLSFARLGSTPPEGVTLPFRSDGHSIYITAEVEGVSGLFGIDTGDSGTVTVFRRFADEHGLFLAPGHNVVSGGGVGGTLSSSETVARTFRIARTGFRSVPISVSDARTGAFFSRSIAGNIGAGILSRFTVTFDYAARTMTLKPNRFVDKVFARERSGLSVTQTEPEAIDVLSVAAGSPGARVGLRAGDRIIALDGRSVAGEKLGAMDMTPLRYGDRPFALTVKRDGAQFTCRVVP